MNSIEELKCALVLLSGGLTPLIAIVTVYIAYQQYRINRLNLKHVLYEKRITVLRTIFNLCEVVIRKGTVDYATCHRFYYDTVESAFILPKEIRDYINELYAKGKRLAEIHLELYHEDGQPKPSKPGVDYEALGKETTQLLLWFTDQFKNSIEIFRKWIAIE